VAIDEGHAIHYAAVRRGTPVYSSDGVEIGKVDEVIDNYREHILDGFVIETTGGKLVFADAPEVARTAERAVILSVDAAAAAELPPPEKAAPHYRPNRGGRLSRFLGGGWKKH
jgi:sporulation protein YlmC with PRC-barrel domain